MLICDKCREPQAKDRAIRPLTLTASPWQVEWKVDGMGRNQPAETPPLARHDLCSSCWDRLLARLKAEVADFVNPVRPVKARPGSGLPAKAGVVFEPEPPGGVAP